MVPNVDQDGGLAGGRSYRLAAADHSPVAGTLVLDVELKQDRQQSDFRSRHAGEGSAPARIDRRGDPEFSLKVRFGIDRMLVGPMLDRLRVGFTLSGASRESAGCRIEGSYVDREVVDRQ